MNSMTYKERMEQNLTSAFAPILLEIKDDSARHLGHAGHNPLGETHFIVKIVSAAFTGKNRVERHRLVYQAVTDEMLERVHALSLSTMSPEEYNRE